MYMHLPTFLLPSFLSINNTTSQMLEIFPIYNISTDYKLALYRPDNELSLTSN